MAGLALSADDYGLAHADGSIREAYYEQNQVTDAYLLGLAVREGLVLTTFDKALLHLAGEHKHSVLVLKAS